MAFRNDRRKKSFFSRIFGLKEKKSSKGNQNPVDFSAEFQEVPAFSAPASPLFMERFSGREPSSMLERINFSKLSSAAPTILESKDFRVFVATWNVGGKPPHIGLDLNDVIPADDQSDIYVLGFQEIVPLNAGNVLVIEDSEPAIKWLGLINQALNRTIEIEGYACPWIPSKYTSSPSLAFGAKSSVFKDSKTTANTFFQKPSLKTVSRTIRTELGRQLKTCNCRSEMARKYCRDSCFRCPQSYHSVEDSSDEEEMETSSPVITDLSAAVAVSTKTNHLRYNLIASKQMVGIFVTIWVKREHVPHIGHLRVSSVGRGILGCLGNKGCISVSMSLYQTSFCFVCCHLASGEKEGDELRRNCDVIEILKSTQFPKICKTPNRRIPERILEHDRVIWLGDLNYRIALSYSETKKLLNDNDWDALFEKDQLKIEREAGRVFKGWNEGKIYFAPTYKYSDNSDAYTGDSVTSKKKRTPAWCDRILWHGDGIMQLSYVRGESKFSDHRPVCAVFVVEVGVADGRLRKSSSSCNMKVGVEELLPPSCGYYPISNMY